MSETYISRNYLDYYLSRNYLDYYLSRNYLDYYLSRNTAPPAGMEYIQLYINHQLYVEPSDRLAPLGIIGAYLRVPLQSFATSQQYGTERFNLDSQLTTHVTTHREIFSDSY